MHTHLKLSYLFCTHHPIKANIWSLWYSYLILFIILFHLYLGNKNSCYIISLNCFGLVFVDFCLIFIFNVSQMISQTVERIFVWTIYLWTCLIYISNCGLGPESQIFYLTRFRQIRWFIQRFIFGSSFWKILCFRILYIVDLSTDFA